MSKLLRRSKLFSAGSATPLSRDTWERMGGYSSLVVVTVAGQWALLRVVALIIMFCSAD